MLSVPRTPKRITRPRNARREEEASPRFFAPIDDNPYFWTFSDRNLLPSQPTVADFYNLRFELLESRASHFADVARSAGLEPSDLMNALVRGSSVMSERAIDAIEGVINDPGPGGLSTVIREERLRQQIELSGLRPEYRERMFDELVELSGYAPAEFEQRKLDVGVGLQFPFMLGGGGPVSTPGRIPSATAILRDPDYVWNLGPATRRHIIEAARGHNLPVNFRIIDRFDDDGIATSIKSVDLRSATYHRPQTLERLVRGFIDQVSGFTGARYAGHIVESSSIRDRALELVVPHTGTAAQQEVVDAAIRYGERRGVAVRVIVYP